MKLINNKSSALKRYRDSAIVRTVMHYRESRHDEGSVVIRFAGCLFPDASHESTSFSPRSCSVLSWSGTFATFLADNGCALRT